jgi:Fis family transcriptional regulator
MDAETIELPLIASHKAQLEHRVKQLTELALINKHPRVYNHILSLVEKPLIDAVLKYTRHNKSKAALILGINRTTLNTKINRINK